MWILSYVESHTAGSPTDPAVKWTSLTPQDICCYISRTYSIEISHGCVKRILKKAGYVKRKPIKSLPTGTSKHRSEQFEILLHLMSLFQAMHHNPILSIDTKKKETLGQLTRNEGVLSKKGGVPKVYSADYPSLSSGKAIPHGIYDVKLQRGYISIGTSHETADFIVDNLYHWWEEYGKLLYKNSTHILILCDCGGANSYRHHRFKHLLQQLARKIDTKIVVVHYPPHCSKYNPIERKLFSHIHRTIKSTILTDVYQVKELIAKTTNNKGLSVYVRVVETFYQTKLPSNQNDINQNRILYHPKLPQFSYTILP